MLVTPKEWIREPGFGEEKDGVVNAIVEGGDVPLMLPLEAYDISEEDVTIGKKQDFFVLLEATPQIQVFDDEYGFYENSELGFAVGLYTPISLFAEDEEIDFDISSQVLISGKVKTVYENPEEYGFDRSNILFVMTCMGYEFEAVIDKSVINYNRLEPGNIICGVFFAQGWPKDAIIKKYEEERKAS